MVELFQRDMLQTAWKSSKGNQLKWKHKSNWYKTDYTGYEGLSEYVVSCLLAFTNLEKDEYTIYATEQIKYKNQYFLGCKSANFLHEDWQLITLEQLFKQNYGKSFLKSIYEINDYKSRMRYLTEQTIRMTGLSEFGTYLCKLLTIDAIFLNEDRHLHNIAVLMDGNGDFKYCPIFDNGGALLSDTKMDYPMNGNLEEMMLEAQSKTICTNFDEQLDIAEELYGKPIQFSFTRKDIQNLLDKEPFYSKEAHERVLNILTIQMRKYQHLFV